MTNLRRTTQIVLAAAPPAKCLSENAYKQVEVSLQRGVAVPCGRLVQR
jgi:hypothetical protein